MAGDDAMFFRAMVGRPGVPGYMASTSDRRSGRHLQMARGSSGGQRDHRSLLGYGRSMFGRVGLCKYPGGVHQGLSHLLSAVRDQAKGRRRRGEDSWAGAAVDTRY